MDSLVSTQWLADNLHSDDLVILDASAHLPAAKRDAAAEFAEGHIPAARFFDLRRLVDETSSVPQALPRPEQLARVLADCGVTAHSRIVIYDDSAVKTAARAWFLLRLHALEQVAVLNGGLGKWKAEGRPTEAGELQSGSVAPISLSRSDRIRFKPDMIANIDGQDEQVIDARDEGRFSGEFVDHVHNMPSGHIPGSCNLPFTRLFNQDGTYRPVSELREIVAAAGIEPDRPVTTTCGSGVTACILLFALHLTGRDDTALYDGSWLDWGSDPDTPKSAPKAQSNAGAQ